MREWDRVRSVTSTRWRGESLAEADQAGKRDRQGRSRPVEQVREIHAEGVNRSQLEAGDRLRIRKPGVLGQELAAVWRGPETRDVVNEEDGRTGSCPVGAAIRRCAATDVRAFEAAVEHDRSGRRSANGGECSRENVEADREFLHKNHR